MGDTVRPWGRGTALWNQSELSEVSVTEASILLGILWGIYWAYWPWPIAPICSIQCNSGFYFHNQDPGRTSHTSSAKQSFEPWKEHCPHLLHLLKDAHLQSIFLPSSHLRPSASQVRKTKVQRVLTELPDYYVIGSNKAEVTLPSGSHSRALWIFPFFYKAQPHSCNLMQVKSQGRLKTEDPRHGVTVHLILTRLSKEKETGVSALRLPAPTLRISRRPCPNSQV